jgi:DNA-binding response OmpR family regulator
VKRETVGVLLVEDNSQFAAMLTYVLREDPFFDYEVVTVPSVDEAVNFLSQHHTDLIILDLILPNGAGVEVVRKIRKCEPNDPLFVLTALQGIEIEMDVLDAMADSFLSKSCFNADNFLRECRRMIVSHRRVAPQLAPTKKLQEELIGILEDCRNNPDAAPFREGENKAAKESVKTSETIFDQ